MPLHYCSVLYRFGFTGWCESGRDPQADQLPGDVDRVGWLYSLADGTYDINFKIYNASSGGDKRWEETQTDVAVTDGLFNVILGGATIGGINLDFSEEYWLEIWIEGEQMSERLRFVSVGYAYRAMVADSAVVAASGGGWVDDGAVVRLQDSTDKVGIGTTSPGEELEIHSSYPYVKFSGHFASDDYQIGVNNYGLAIYNYDDEEYAAVIDNDGDIDVYNHEVRRYYGFPRPDYSSGWQVISAGQTLTFTHGLGGSYNDYVVDLMLYDNSGGITGPHQVGYGGWRDDGTYGGAYWHELDNSKVKVTRASSDVSVDWVRVRIWVIRD